MTTKKDYVEESELSSVFVLISIAIILTPILLLFLTLYIADPKLFIETSNHFAEHWKEITSAISSIGII